LTRRDESLLGLLPRPFECFDLARGLLRLKHTPDFVLREFTFDNVGKGLEHPRESRREFGLARHPFTPGQIDPEPAWQLGVAQRDGEPQYPRLLRPTIGRH